MKEKKLYKIAFMGDKDHGCDIISTLESWGSSNDYSRNGSDPEYAYFINDLGTIDFIHNSAFLSEEMKNFYFLFWHDYNIECKLKVGETFNYGGLDYDVDSILYDANNRCIVYKLKSFGIGVEYKTIKEKAESGITNLIEYSVGYNYAAYLKTKLPWDIKSLKQYAIKYNLDDIKELENFSFYHNNKYTTINPNEL